MIRGSFAAALLCMGAPALAKDEEPCGKDMVCASAPATIAAEMMRAGYQALVDKDKLGDPMIESAAAGYKFQVLFYGCEKKAACDSIQFYAGFENDAGYDLAFVNGWNGAKRFSQLSIDKDGDLVLRHDVTTLGGLTRRNFADELDWWATMLGEFDGHLAEHRKAKAAK